MSVALTLSLLAWTVLIKPPSPARDSVANLIEEVERENLTPPQSDLNLQMSIFVKLDFWTSVFLIVKNNAVALLPNRATESRNPAFRVDNGNFWDAVPSQKQMVSISNQARDVHCNCLVKL